MSETQQRGDCRGGERRGHDDRRGQASREEGNQYLERVVAINRAAEVAQDGRRSSFTAPVVVGDGEGTIGVGYGKAKEVPVATAKGVEEAKRHFFRVPLIQCTISHPVQGEKAAGMVLLRPVSSGIDVIAGGSARVVFECAGAHDVLAKSLSSTNAIDVVHATVNTLQQLEEPEAVAKRRGLPVEDAAPVALPRVRKEEVAG